MSKGKDSFRVNTKDAFAFFMLIQFDLLFSIKDKERLRVKPLKDALAFTLGIILRLLTAVNP